MKRALLLCVLVAGACGQVDPCAQTKGACLTVHVTSAAALTVDELDLHADGAFVGDEVSTHTGATSLPVRLGVVPSPSAMLGDLTLSVVGKLAGQEKGRGTASHVLTDNDRGTIELVLVASGAEVVDMAGSDGATQQDLAGADLTVSCTPGDPIACANSGAQLQSCNATGDGYVTVGCQYNCDDGPPPHCKQFVPHPPITQALLAAGGTGEIVMSGSFTINTDTGAIQNFRPANSVPGNSETQAGIAFFTSGTSGVFLLKKLTFDETALVTIIGSRALVIGATDSILVHGVIDGRSNNGVANVCQVGFASAGGSIGGTGTAADAKAPGTGGGNAPHNVNSTGTGGGGGGGNGDHGGNGGTGSSSTGAAQTGGAGGPIVALAFPLVGGSGGGGGANTSRYGGSGGGAVHFVAINKIQIGGGTAASPMGILVSGCGSLGGIMNGAPGGGGAGGNIVLEAPTVEIGTYGALVSNGGGGGSGSGHTPSDGATSGFSTSAPAGGAGSPTASNDYAGGGVGGYYNTPTGGNGVSVSGAATNTTGGGGGGAVGQIRIFNFGGGGVTPGAAAIISPQLGQVSSTGTMVSGVLPIVLQ